MAYGCLFALKVLIAYQYPKMQALDSIIKGQSYLRRIENDGCKVKELENLEWA